MRVVCIPPSLPTSPAEPRLGEVWSREGALVAMATGTAFLPRRRRRRRPQDFRAKPLPTNFSSPETQPGALGRPWGTLGKHQPLPAGKQDLGMGSSSVKTLPVPSRTGRLVQRPLVSPWRRRTQRTGRIFIGSPPFQGLSGPVDSQSGCTTSQRTLNTRILGNHPFFLKHFSCCIPQISPKGCRDPLHPKARDSTSRDEGADRGGPTNTDPFVARSLGIVCNYFQGCTPRQLLII